METIRHTIFFFTRQIRANFRLPAALLLSIFHPFVWMFLFGQLFQEVASLRGFGTDSYVQFLAPGIAVMSAIFGSNYSGLGTLGDIHSGLLDKFLASPVPRSSIILGPLLNTTLQTVLQSAIILLTAIGMGARPDGGVVGLLVVLLTVALLGGTFAALSHSLALITRNQRTMISVVNFISLPLMFLSSMMMARDLMPSWMRILAVINPVDWAVTTSRAAFNGYAGPEILRSFGLLALFAGLAWGFTIRALFHYQRSE